MRKAAVLFFVTATICAGAVQAGAATGPAADPSAGSWPVYHRDVAGSGVAAGVTAVDTARRAWTSPVLDGEIYGEPLVWSGRIYVATENDTVYALSARTGAVAWSAHLGRPVPSSSLPCGNITPTVGITGTPVIDESRNEIFVVAGEDRGGTLAHVLVGLNAASGEREMTQDVDPPGAETAALLQRTGLTLDAGQVVFGFGGNYGDCASYRGQVVAVSETGGTPKDFTVDAAAGESEGAIWMGGAAPVVDTRGDVWVSAGNGSVHSAAHAFDNSDSALELSSSLRLLQFFAPGNWPENNSRDLDMSMVPALLSDGQVLLAGKSRIVYLLDGARLGGIGGQRASLAAACGDDIDGGAAVAGTTAYLPCLSGIIAVRATQSPVTLHLLWSSGTGGGPPIVAAGLVWTIGPTGILYGLDPATGRVRQQATVGAPANHFPTPSVGDGLFLVPSAQRVTAFAAVGSGAASSPQPVTSPTATPADRASSRAGTAPRDGSVPAGAIAGIVVVGLVVIGGIGRLLRRQSRLRLAGRVGGGTGRGGGLRALLIGAAMTPGHGAQLADAGRAGQDDQEHAADGRQQQGHAKREMTVRAHVGDVDLGAVLQDEDQQEQQDDAEETQGDPEAADPGAPDLERRCGGQGCGLRRGSRIGHRGRWLGAGGAGREFARCGQVRV